MLTRQRKLLAAACALIVLLAGALGAAFSVQLGREMERQFYRRAELFAHTLSDLVLRKEEPQFVREFVQNLVSGDVIYAQVVRAGEVIAEVHSPAAAVVPLTVVPLDRALQFEQRGEPLEAPFLDVRRALVVGPQPLAPESYVRLGFSLASLQNQTFSRQLEVGGWSLAGAALALGCMLLAHRWWTRPARRPPAPEAPSPVPEPSSNGVLACGALCIDDAAKRVWVGEREVALSPKEYGLLKLLAQHPGRIFSSDEVVGAIWDEDDFAVAGDVKKYVYLLRQKLEEDPSQPRWVQTVRGFGYRLCAPEAD